jgi:hypothetical protein
MRALKTNGFSHSKVNSHSQDTIEKVLPRLPWARSHLKALAIINDKLKKGRWQYMPPTAAAVPYPQVNHRFAARHVSQSCRLLRRGFRRVARLLAGTAGNARTLASINLNE